MSNRLDSRTPLIHADEPITVNEVDETAWVGGRDMKVSVTRLSIDQTWLKDFVEERFNEQEVDKMIFDAIEQFKKELLTKLAVLNPDVHTALAALLTEKRLGGG